MNHITRTALILIALLMPMRLLAYWDFEYKDIYYKITDEANRTVEVTSPKHRAGTINIPQSVTYNNKEYAVKAIGRRAFASCQDIMAVSIAEGVEVIDHSAFAFCDKLVSVKLPKSLRIIDKDAFQECINLRTITIGLNVEKIDIQAFMGCTQLEKVTIESNIKSLELRAFGNCTSLNMIVLKADLPPACHSTFDKVDPNAEVYVNKKALGKFKKDRYWSQFHNIKAVK